MDPAQFFATSRLVIVAGKGGVGKTTVTATLARAASRAGLSALIVEVEGKSGLAELFGRPPLTYDETELVTADPDTGAGRIELITLPLTTHRADADLWVHDYQTILFDRAKHAWCANPDSLSAPARAFYEPWWRDLAAREMAAMGHTPVGGIADYDADRDAVLIELPTSGLMSRAFGDRGKLVVTIDKADLAIGDFSKLRAQIGHT